MTSSSESLQVECPHCGARIRLRDASLLGKKVRCPRCQDIFRSPEPLPELDEFFGEDSTQEEEAASVNLPRKRHSKTSKGKKSSRKRNRNNQEWQRKLLWIIPVVIVVLLVGAGLTFVPFGKMARTVNRFMPGSDSYHSLSLEIQEVRENYEDLKNRLIDRGPIKEDEIRSAAEACARKYESIRKRALMVRSRSFEEAESTRKDLEEQFRQISQRRSHGKMRHPFEGQEISRIEDNIGRYSPRVQYAMAFDALGSIPDPPSQENSIYQALSEMYQLEYDALLEMFKISSKDQIDSVVKVVQEKSRRVSEISDQIEKEANSNPQQFSKQVFQFSSTAKTRLANLNEILHASDRSNHDLEQAVDEFDRQRTRLFNTVRDSRWKAGRIALGLEPTERPPDPIIRPDGTMEFPNRPDLNHQPKPANPRTEFKPPQPPGKMQEKAPPGQQPEQDSPPKKKQPDLQPAVEENPFKAESPPEKSEEEESPFKIEK